jgi:hypothetical protein
MLKLKKPVTEIKNIFHRLIDIPDKAKERSSEHKDISIGISKSNMQRGKKTKHNIQEPQNIQEQELLTYV